MTGPPKRSASPPSGEDIPSKDARVLPPPHPPVAGQGMVMGHSGVPGQKGQTATCFSCYTSHAKCSRQMPCERCTRLGLMCIPNPRKQGRPLGSHHIRVQQMPGGPLTQPPRLVPPECPPNGSPLLHGGIDPAYTPPMAMADDMPHSGAWAAPVLLRHASPVHHDNGYVPPPAFPPMPQHTTASGTPAVYPEQHAPFPTAHIPTIADICQPPHLLPPTPPSTAPPPASGRADGGYVDHAPSAARPSHTDVSSLPVFPQLVTPEALAGLVRQGLRDGKVMSSKAEALIMSWHYWSLRQRRDTTCGLIYALAPLVNIDVDALGTAVPPLHGAQFQAASQAIYKRTEALWSLPRDRAVCAVSICGGSLTVTTSPRFEAVYMSRATVHAALSSHGLLPFHVWSRLMSNEAAVDDYWRLVLRAMVEVDPSTAICYSTLQVVDAFDMQMVETCSVGIYASLDGLCSYYWIILQPSSQPYRGAFAPHHDSSHLRLAKSPHVSSHDTPPAQASPQMPPSSHTTMDCQHGQRSALLDLCAHNGPAHAYSPAKATSASHSHVHLHAPRPSQASHDSQPAGSSSHRPDSAAPPHYTPSGGSMHTTQGQQHAGRREAAERGPDVGYHPTAHHLQQHGANGGVAEGRHDGMDSDEGSEDESSTSSHIARDDDYRPPSKSNMARSVGPASLDGATFV